MALRPRATLTAAETTSELADAIEGVRRGTLQQFESEWILLSPDQAVTRRHGLGEEVPALVSVDRDDSGDGRNAIGAIPSGPGAPADVTIESTIEEVTITNDTTFRQFFRIRAR